MRELYYKCQQSDNEATDSLVFVDKGACYIGGYNPNWLCWRDEHTSKFARSNITDVGITARVIADVSQGVYKTLDSVVVGPITEYKDYSRENYTVRWVNVVYVQFPHSLGY